MNSSQRNRLRSLHCPNCGRLISASASRCIHCHLPLPGWFARAPLLGDLVRERISFVNGIVVACFILFVLALVFDMTGGQQLLRTGAFDFLSPTGSSLYKLGMGGAVPLAQGRTWTLVTAMFLHGGLLHIGFNMLWLRRIGPWVEELFDASRFFLIYILSGVFGGLLTSFVGTSFYVGASGAIFGLFGALIYYGRSRGGVFGSAVFRTMLIWALIGLGFGFLSDNIDNWGHVGGFAAGVLLALLLGYEERRPARLWMHVLAALLFLVVALAFIVMVVTFFTA